MGKSKKPHAKQQRIQDLTGLPASLRSLSSSKVALPKAFQTQLFDLRLSFLTKYGGI